MRVVVDQDVFLPGITMDLDLMELLLAGYLGRHALLTDPTFSEAGTAPVNGWLQTLPADLRLALELALDDGLSRAPNISGTCATVRVPAVTSSDWTRAEFTVADAARLLRTPLRLLVENWRSDIAFLLCLMGPTARRELEAAIEDGRVELLHGGGLGEIKRMVEALDAPSPALRQRVELARLWVLLDRDSNPANRSQPSKESDEIVALCARLTEPWPLAHHRLERRTIENYLPRAALHAWVDQARGAERARRRAAVDAFYRLSQPARHSFPMKRGLLRDLPAKVRDEVAHAGWTNDALEHLDPLYRGVALPDVRTLAEGFGYDVASGFSDSKVPPDWMQSEQRNDPAMEAFRTRLLLSLNDRM